MAKRRRIHTLGAAPNRENNPKILYAIAWEKLSHGRVTAVGHEYMHAVNAADAKFIFFSDVQYQRNHRISAVAPVVGYFQDERTGEIHV